MTDDLRDYYAILAIDSGASQATVRTAFRARVLEVHPDKTALPAQPERLALVMEAFEVLSDAEGRERYDRAYRLRNRSSDWDGESEIPHVTESDKPANRARAILYLLLNGQAEQAIRRLDALEELAVPYLSGYLEEDEFIDAAFLLGDYFEGRSTGVKALEWFQQVLRRESNRRRHRPCYEEAVDRCKRLLIHTMTSDVDPRVALEYLRRAESLDLTRLEQVEVCKRRCQCYLGMDMRHEAANQLRKAIELQPQIKGIQRLREALAGYL